MNLQSICVTHCYHEAGADHIIYLDGVLTQPTFCIPYLHPCRQPYVLLRLSLSLQRTAYFGKILKEASFLYSYHELPAHFMTVPITGLCLGAVTLP